MIDTREIAAEYRLTHWSGGIDPLFRLSAGTHLCANPPALAGGSLAHGSSSSAQNFKRAPPDGSLCNGNRHEFLRHPYNMSQSSQL
jgi:hypothetical protein